MLRLSASSQPEFHSSGLAREAFRTAVTATRVEVSRAGIHTSTVEMHNEENDRAVQKAKVRTTHASLNCAFRKARRETVDAKHDLTVHAHTARGHSPRRCILQMQIVLVKSDRFDELNTIGISNDDELEL